MPRGAEGRRLCRYCSREVPRGRRTMCSDECVRALVLDGDPREQRKEIERRDHGVCAECGTDTDDLARRFHLNSSENPLWHRLPLPGTDDIFELRGVAQWWLRRGGRRELHRLGFTGAGHLWEMDHRVEVAAGGGGRFDPSNLQTLCVPCHRAKTAFFTRSRAALRRLGKALSQLGGP